jgi:hypothetical protein
VLVTAEVAMSIVLLVASGLLLRALSEESTVSLRFVTPGYFQTLGIPQRAGRDVSETDTREAPAVAVVSQSFVDREPQVYLPQPQVPDGRPRGRVDLRVPRGTWPRGAARRREPLRSHRSGPRARPW